MKVQWPELGEFREFNLQDFNQAIVIPAKSALGQLRQALTGNLTIRDNQYAAIVTLGAVPGTSNATLTSSTEYIFANPLKTKPIGFTPIAAINNSGTCLRVDAIRLNTARTDGLIGVTADFKLDFNASGASGEYVVSTVTRTGALSVTNGSARTIAQINVPEGDFDIAITGNVLGAPTGGTVIACALSLTANTLPSSNLIGNEYAQTPTMPNANADVTLCVPRIRKSISALTTYHLVIQINMTGGTATANGEISARRAQETRTTTGIVTGILWGG